MLLLQSLYALCAILLSAYGLNSLLLTWLFLRHRDDPVPAPAPPSTWPYVTVQLPIYNELHTVERLLEAVANLDYPHDRLEIQLLDDSTDQTVQVAARTIRRLQVQGINASHITRPDRAGFKAGALALGLSKAKGELIAVFDADFVPPPDFLRQVVPHFADPAIGCVQTRWDHLNRDYSPFTQVQALGVDGYFVVEQTARSRTGLFINFNGSAGVWRRVCIESAGGWQGDTLTEDLDLSYRAQLCGWRICYLKDVRVPGELPVQISAFKRQQARWAQGSIQTAIKLLGPLLRSGHPWNVKLEGTIHLSCYMVHPLILMTILLTWPMSFSRSWIGNLSAALMIAAVGPPALYAVSLVSDREGWPSQLLLLVALMLLGLGMALNNGLAALKAVLGVDEGFHRTPKFALQGPSGNWLGSAYALRDNRLMWGELGFAVLALALLVTLRAHWSLGVWLVLYAGGFGCVAAAGIYQAYQCRQWLARQARSSGHNLARTGAHR